MAAACNANASNGKVSKLVHAPGTRATIACGWVWRWLSCCCSIPSILFIFFLCSASEFIFCVASHPIPTTTTPPASSVLNSTASVPPPAAAADSHSIVDLRIAIPIAAASTLLIVTVLCLCVMAACFNFLRRKRDRVAVIDEEVENDSVGYNINDERKINYWRRFSWDEMERVTMNFSRVIGSGGFSTVYLAQFPDSSTNLAAVKIHSGSERLNRVYKQELEILLSLHHQNIVKLLGYCDDREDQGVLVFEYISNGSLQEKLHGCGDGRGLSWKSRMVIAFQLAQAIEYLHERCSLQIVHGDIKASNILLDEQLNCKLCDFGSAKMGFSSTVLPPSSSKQLMMMGSPGYVDPHYLRTGIASKKNDVYSFGVIVLQLITGMEAFCSEKGQMLTSIAGPILLDDDEPNAMVAEMVDPRLGSDCHLEEARVMASISALCLRHPPTIRPSAANILQTMKDKIPSISFLFSPDKYDAGIYY
uniref:Protein kinase domain-containing protein n=1 Tax=Davidia involucrata TaxID=16924 RepID=A0A5B7A582_DAVIN